MSFVQAQGCRIYHERHGQGPALVFCHGAGSNAATWWQQIPFFSSRFTCLTLDCRGFGRSLARPDSLTWDALTRDLLAVLDAERIDRAALVCQSLSGGMGLRLALAHPDRVWALVSSGSPLYQQINAFNPLVSGDMTAELKRRLQALNHPDALIGCERLAEVACPVLLVSGEHDPLVPPELARSIAALFPNARAIEMSACGHSPYFERPAEFNAQVGRFLRSCLGGAPADPVAETGACS